MYNEVETYQYPTHHMEKSFTALSATFALTLSLLIPATSFAYLSPEQVFGGQSLTINRVDPTNQPPPPQQREGESVIQQQQLNSAAQRNAAQQSLQSIDDMPVDTYTPPVSTAEPLGLFDQNVQYEKRQERLQDAKSGGPTIIIGADGAVIDANGNVLHSGAPRVTATGPESILTIIAMILAGCSTLAYASLRHQRIASLPLSV